MRSIELLAPARDLQTGIEAIRHGADAVYIGAPKFGARAAAGNSVDDIRQLVDFARPYAVKVYVTLNTIIFDNELEEAYQLVDELQEAGVDALIVQDLALLNCGKQIPLHASTQMDNRTPEKVAQLRDMGFRQVVLARELTLDEMREIHQRVPDVQLEAFIHGAICVSYNGQCYASQHCFGRSANRGECAQFCRLPFDLVDEEGRVLQKQRHLLSLRDMNQSANLEAMLDAGISSLKIEGRLKDISYVKNIVAHYRCLLDDIFRRRPEYKRSSLGHEIINFKPSPAKSFNRLFTTYFLQGRTADMANIVTPKSMGEPISDSGHGWKEELHNGDGLCFVNEEGQLTGFRVNRIEGNKIHLVNGKTLPLPSASSHLHLYRNYDNAFEQKLSKPTAVRKINVRWLLKDVDEGFLLRLIREDGQTVEQVFRHPHEPARTPQVEQIKQQLCRLGDTPYEAIDADIEISQNWFIPNSVLAEWRRAICNLRFQTPTQTAPLTPNEAMAVKHEEWAHITYLGNVSNHPARQFYLNHGAKEVDWALEVTGKDHVKSNDRLLIMTCRYCIRHELGMCLKNGHKAKDLFLRLADGRRFPLHFDCKKCQMLVYAEKA